MCVPSEGPLECGPGTHEENGLCVPDSQGSLECGPGTHEENGLCVPTEGPLECGPGTHEQGGLCLPDDTPDGPTFEVRVGTDEIPADGYSSIPVLVIGTNIDGTPYTGQVVLNTSRPGAGSIDPPAPTLGTLGALSYYTPCSSAIPGCTGPVEITVAEAVAPRVVVATSGPLELVEPEGVGSPSPCLIGGNVMFFDGVDDFIFTGTQTVTQAAWSAGASSDGTVVSIHLDPSDRSQGLWWDLTFSSRKLGMPLMEQVYEGAERYPFESTGSPGLSISGDGRGCNTLTGRFQIEELVRDNQTVSSFTATFEQHCEGGPGALRGCIHLE